MELFLELTQQCNMKCIHCLRGKPTRKVMENDVMWHAVHLFKDAYQLGIGGGEPTLAPKQINNLRYLTLSQDHCFEDFFMVTNGVVLSKIDLEELNPDDFCSEEDYIEAMWNREYNDPDNLISNLAQMNVGEKITINISNDTFHTKGWKDRYNHMKEQFERFPGVEIHPHTQVLTHTDYDKLLSMGKWAGAGKNEELYLKHEPMPHIIYVDVNGYVWPSCNLSYTFMLEFQDSPLCLGNVLKDSREEIEMNYEILKHLAQENNESGVLLIAEGYCGFDLDNLYELELNDGRNQSKNALTQC